MKPIYFVVSLILVFLVIAAVLLLLTGAPESIDSGIQNILKSLGLGV